MMILVMACSNAKREKHARAFELYDGPSWRMVRRYISPSGYLLKDGRPAGVVYALSAKYGLIHSATRIKTYDKRLHTLTEVRELVHEKDGEIPGLALAFREKPVHVFGGQLYQYGFLTYSARFRDHGINVYSRQISGPGIGYQLSALRKYLSQFDRISRARDQGAA